MKDKKKLVSLMTLAVAAHGEGKVADSHELFSHFCEELNLVNDGDKFADQVSVALAAVLEEAMAGNEDVIDEEAGDTTTEESDEAAQSGDHATSEEADLLDEPDDLESMDLDEALDDSESTERANAIDANEDFTEEAALAVIREASQSQSAKAPVEISVAKNIDALFG